MRGVSAWGAIPSRSGRVPSSDPTSSGHLLPQAGEGARGTVSLHRDELRPFLPRREFRRRVQARRADAGARIPEAQAGPVPGDRHACRQRRLRPSLRTGRAAPWNGGVASAGARPRGARPRGAGACSRPGSPSPGLPAPAARPTPGRRGWRWRWRARSTAWSSASCILPRSSRLLRACVGRDRRAKVLALDGYVGLNAFIPPIERRGLVLVDPPFESPDEFERLTAALLAAHAKWRAGVLMAWYPIKDQPLDPSASWPRSPPPASPMPCGSSSPSPGPRPNPTARARLRRAGSS